MKKGLVFTFSACLLFLLSCKKDQAEIAEFNKNCSCAQEVSADFTMEELANPIGFTHGERRTETDTTYGFKNVRFHAKEANAEYTWKIGDEIIHEQTFYRYFNNDFSGQSLPMTLVVKKTPNLICNPFDDGHDSITKNLTISPSLREDFFDEYQWRWEGGYRFLEEDGIDSVDMLIDIGVGKTVFGDPFTDAITIGNFNGLGDTLSFWVDNSNYRQLWTSQNTCYTPNFEFRLDGSFKLFISASKTDKCPVNLMYTGRKLN